MFAGGDRFSVADAAALPFLQRINDEYGFPEGAAVLTQWYARCLAVDGVEATVLSPGSYWWWW